MHAICAQTDTDDGGIHVYLARKDVAIFCSVHYMIRSSCHEHIAIVHDNREYLIRL